MLGQGVTIVDERVQVPFRIGLYFAVTRTNILRSSVRLKRRKTDLFVYDSFWWIDDMTLQLNGALTDQLTKKEVKTGVWLYHQLNLVHAWKTDLGIQCEHECDLVMVRGEYKWAQLVRRKTANYHDICIVYSLFGMFDLTLHLSAVWLGENPMTIMLIPINHPFADGKFSYSYDKFVISHFGTFESDRFLSFSASFFCAETWP